MGGLGLEIGPGYNPLFPKTEGYRVETLDHASADELRRKYATHPHVDVSLIEELDYVSDGRSIRDAIGKDGRFDWIAASHVFEHLPDPIGFLRDCEALLRPGGILALVIPDKRYCFDILQSPTSAGLLLQAHLERRTRHTPGIIFDHFAYAATRGGVIAWGPRENGGLSFIHDLAEAQALFSVARDAAAYLDVHAWHFTPSGLRLVVLDLHTLGLIGLQEKTFHPTVGLEFFIALSTVAAGCPFDRLALARTMLKEEAEVALRL
jgi:SAM-dependent methyltransferase